MVKAAGGPDGVQPVVDIQAQRVKEVCLILPVVIVQNEYFRRAQVSPVDILGQLGLDIG